MQPTAPELALDVTGLCMRYGSTDALHDVTLQARHGDVMALLGPNGAGKTTTIEILEGFRMRSAGHVQALGIDPGRGDERWRARIGILLQSWRDHARWRVRELLAHQGSYYTPYSTTLIHRPWEVDELLATVGLSPQADQRIMTLSGGQRRRLDIAMALVGRPELLFLDEPTAGLDPVARRQFHRLVRRLADGRGTTILLATHDLEEAEMLADRIIILDGGRVIGSGTPAELARQIAGKDVVKWTCNGHRYTRSTSHSTQFARGLFARYGDRVAELEIRRASLEDTYLSLVRQAEAGHHATPASAPEGEIA
jgi:ABC-2 type transport system ATP-binding protein